MNRKIVIAVIMAVIGLTARGQEVGIRTNVLSDAFLNVNLGVEVGLAPQWTLNVGGELNDWTLSHGRKWKHWDVSPEARYWFCERFAGHFVGVHAIVGQYNVAGIGKRFSLLGTDYGAPLDHRYQGLVVGAGIAYGYAFVLGRHWNLEPEIGVGYAYMTYDRFACTGCGRQDGSGHHNYVGLTKAAVNIVYVF